MRTFLNLMLLMSCALCITAHAQGVALADIGGGGPEGERAAVVQVLQQYLRVTDAKDAQAIGRALHGSALLSSVSASGALRLMSQDEWWDRVARIPDGTPSRRSQLRLVDVVGFAAVARIDISDAQGRSSSDLFTLLKTQAGWRIVNKVLSVPL